MIREAIAQLVAGGALGEAEAAAAMEEIMTGEATPSQLGAFLTALRLKGETVEEIAGMARVMRDKALHVPVPSDVTPMDTCGTGGDGSGTFNVSTTAALLVAALGQPVAKHGNRAATSRCGSADVLEALGVRMDLGPEQVAACIVRAGLPPRDAPCRPDAARDRHPHRLQHPRPADQSRWRALSGARRGRRASAAADGHRAAAPGLCPRPGGARHGWCGRTLARGTDGGLRGARRRGRPA